MDARDDAGLGGLPIGRSGLLEAATLSAGEDRAVLVRERGGDERARALLTTDKLPEGERLVVMPLDDDVEVRVDGDALAVWLGSASLMPPRRTEQVAPESVPLWASLAGGVILLIVVALAVIGSAVTFGWILEALT